jgi:hypothetical protein
MSIHQTYTKIMKKNFLLPVLALCLLVTATFGQSRETRNVSDFTKIAYRIPGKLYLRQGNTTKVEVEASKETLKNIETNVEGDRLVIETPSKWNWKWNDDERINVYITVRNLEAVSVSGSGDLVGEGKFNTGEIHLNVSGSGSMKLEIEATGDVEADVSGSGELIVKGRGKGFESDVSGSGRVQLDMAIDGGADFGISGSGKIEAKGRARQVKAAISGSGKVLAANLETDRCDVRISGSGDVEINVKDELDANISGSGSVSYKGNPSKVNSHASGSGSVSKM